MVDLLRVTRRIAGFRLLVVLSALLSLNLVMLNPANAQTAPGLGTAASFAVLGSTTVTNTGPSVIIGDLGLSPGTAVPGFPPGVVTPPAAMYVADAVALQALNDATTAYNTLGVEPCGSNLTGQDLGGLTLTTGVYCFDTSAQLTGALTLDAQGDPNAVFIFKMGSSLTTASASSVAVINGGSDCNIWWQVGSSATIGTTTTFGGSILALSSITFTSGASTTGRVLALMGSVTLDTNTMGSTDCITPLVGPTATFTPSSTDTPDPTATFTPISTSIPGATATFTLAPAATSTPISTSIPGATATSTLAPVATSIPAATQTLSDAANTATTAAQAILGVTTFTPSPTMSANAQVMGLPNTGGGPPQPTYWLNHPYGR